MAKSARKSADQIRKDVTSKMVEALKQGVRPWAQPWVGQTNCGMPMNFASDRRYSGINPMILIFQAMVYGYGSKFWGTSAAWLKKVGAHVRKDETATHVVLFTPIPKKGKDGMPEKDANGKPKTIPLMREFPVFNVEQLTAPSIETLLGVPSSRGILGKLLGETSAKRTAPITKDELIVICQKYLPAKSQPTGKETKVVLATKLHLGIKANMQKYETGEVILNQDPDFGPAEALIAATGAKIKHGGSTASYRPSTDEIKIPNKRSFKSITDYYQTMFHELAHWCEADGRIGKKEGHTYAWGELVAEMSSCFTLMALNVPLAETMLPKTQGYLDHWVKAMGEDPKYLFEAATWASKVCDYLLTSVNMQNPEYEKPEDEPELLRAA